ncbi:MAG: molybdopterin-synthase adenylyltransferase MoeB [Lachnospiraceae bacterium]|nr:molybdopterin-synthase adenylyltransferase MoeB [Lachnospiraceae bacterium]
MKVYVAATLKVFFGRNDIVEIEGNTIRKALDGLAGRYQEAAGALFNEEGKLRGFINLYVDDENYTDSSRWDEELSEKAELLLLPTIAGGAVKRESIISEERRKEISFDDREIDRWGKHLMLREIGVKGQKRIKAARVVVFGAGALGSPVIQYLAAAGVGTLRVVDEAEVSLSDLQAQVIHTERDIGRPKAASARDKIRNLNRKLEVKAENTGISADNIPELLEDFDVAVDCTDNYRTRYLIGDACAIRGIPLVSAAVYQFEGQVSVFNYEDGPCYRCAFPEPPARGLVPTCSEGGTISPLSGVIGSLQANEVLKLIIGIGEILSGKLLVFDSLNLRTRLLKLERRKGCPICGKNPTIYRVEDFDYEDFCGLKESEEEEPVEGIEPEELVRRLDSREPMTIIDVREPHERAINRFPDAIVIPIGQLARRQKELDPDVDTIFICKEGKRSILAINTLREAGYKGPMFNLKGGIDAAKDIVLSHEGAWL